MHPQLLELQGDDRADGRAHCCGQDEPDESGLQRIDGRSLRFRSMAPLSSTIVVVAAHQHDHFSLLAITRNGIDQPVFTIDPP